MRAFDHCSRILHLSSDDCTSRQITASLAAFRVVAFNHCVRCRRGLRFRFFDKLGQASGTDGPVCLFKSGKCSILWRGKKRAKPPVAGWAPRLKPKALKGQQSDTPAAL